MVLIEEVGEGSGDAVARGDGVADIDVEGEVSEGRAGLDEGVGADRLVDDLRVGVDRLVDALCVGVGEPGVGGAIRQAGVMGRGVVVFRGA